MEGESLEFLICVPDRRETLLNRARDLLRGVERTRTGLIPGVMVEAQELVAEALGRAILPAERWGTECKARDPNTAHTMLAGYAHSIAMRCEVCAYGRPDETYDDDLAREFAWDRKEWDERRGMTRAEIEAGRMAFLDHLNWVYAADGGKTFFRDDLRGSL